MTNRLDNGRKGKKNIRMHQRRNRFGGPRVNERYATKPDEHVFPMASPERHLPPQMREVLHRIHERAIAIFPDRFREEGVTVHGRDVVFRIKDFVEEHRRRMCMDFLEQCGMLETAPTIDRRTVLLQSALEKQEQAIEHLAEHVIQAIIRSMKHEQGRR